MLITVGGDIKLTPASSVGRSQPPKVKGKEGGNHWTHAAQATQLPGEEAAQRELTKDIFCSYLYWTKVNGLQHRFVSCSFPSMKYLLATQGIKTGGEIDILMPSRRLSKRFWLRTIDISFLLSQLQSCFAAHNLSLLLTETFTLLSPISLHEGKSVFHLPFSHRSLAFQSYQSTQNKGTVSVKRCI